MHHRDTEMAANLLPVPVREQCRERAGYPLHDPGPCRIRELEYLPQPVERPEGKNRGRMIDQACPLVRHSTSATGAAQ